MARGGTGKADSDTSGGTAFALCRRGFREEKA